MDSAVQATDEEEVMRSMSQVGDLRNELAAADEREAAARQSLREAERALEAAQAEAARLRAAATAAEERRSSLEAELAQVGRDRLIRQRHCCRGASVLIIWLGLC
jgi:chromosome segregation ATPase